MAKDGQYKKSIDDFYEYDVMKYMKTGKGSLKNPSATWVWHHPHDVKGRIRLIPKSQHKDPLLQDVLHPAPNGGGGYSIYK
jgi:hypothetical protein